MRETHDAANRPTPISHPHYISTVHGGTAVLQAIGSATEISR